MAEILSSASPTGSFDHAALASGRRFDPRDFVTDESILGLTREGGYIWGAVRDDDGTLYNTMRRVAPARPDDGTSGANSLGGRWMLLSTGTGRPGLQIRKEARHAVDSAAITRELTDPETATLSSSPDAHGEPMRLVLNRDNFHYSEGGHIDMFGTMAVQPLQWYLPGRDAAMLYITQTWLVEGTVLGKPARGFLFWEEAWMYPGGRLYIEKDALRAADYFTWYSWANHWDDGSCEVGHFLRGHSDFHVAVTAHSDGTVTSARSMETRIKRAEDGYWHDGIEYTIDGVKWACDPDPDGRMALGEIPNPQQEGRIHRVDDARRPDIWMAWGETVPHTDTPRK